MITTSTETFEKRIRSFVEEMNRDYADSVFGMMKPEYAGCNLAGQELTLSYPAQSWERNPTGAIHGGILGTMIDTSMGTLTYALTGGLTPTINLTVSYLRPAPGNERIFIRAKASRIGRSVAYVTAEIWAESAPDKLVATAEGTFRSYAE